MGGISIETAAREAEVSVATVSRVINRHSVVKPATIKRVKTVIDRLGYVQLLATRICLPDAPRARLLVEPRLLLPESRTRP